MNKFLAYGGQDLVDVDFIKDPPQYEDSAYKQTTDRSV